MEPLKRQAARPDLKVVVSGSFHRHLHIITGAVQELASLSIQVLSPADPRVVESRGEFLYLASDRVRSVRLVQDRHLESIRASDFLWLVCPDGYVGQSSSMEIGYAAAARVPVFGTHTPCDLTLREYVSVVPRLSDAIRTVQDSARRRTPEGILIDPHASVEEAHDILAQMDAALTSRNGLDDSAARVHRGLANLQAKLRLPTYMQ
jgi:hypothetical protein